MEGRHRIGSEWNRHYESTGWEREHHRDQADSSRETIKHYSSWLPWVIWKLRGNWRNGGLWRCHLSQSLFGHFVHIFRHNSHLLVLGCRVAIRFTTQYYACQWAFVLLHCLASLLHWKSWLFWTTCVHLDVSGLAGSLKLDGRGDRILQNLDAGCHFGLRSTCRRIARPSIRCNLLVRLARRL